MFFGARAAGALEKTAQELKAISPDLKEALENRLIKQTRE